MGALIHELTARQDELGAQLTAILEPGARGKRPLTATESETADKLQAEFDRARADVRRETERLARERTGPGHDPFAGLPGAALPASVARQRAVGAGRDGRTYADLFGDPRPSPFATHDDFLRAVHATTVNGLYDPRLGMLAAMNTAVSSDGGFAIPEPLAQTWLDSGLEDEVVRPRATVWPMTADQLGIPAFDDYDHSSGSIAGFKAAWTAELGAQTDTQAKLRKIELKALKLLLSTQISNEMLADGGQSFQDQLVRKMPLAVSWSLDDRFINGTGIGQPLGILNDPALITITKEGSQPANTFVLENALKMYERLYPGGYANAVWIINHSVVPQLYTLVIKIKNVAGAENVGGGLAPYFAVGPNRQMSLLGIPIVVTEKSPALSTKGDVILADLTQYAIGLRREIFVESSRHAGWSTDSTYYRAVVRAVGQGTWTKPLTPKAGSTRSWVIVLESR